MSGRWPLSRLPSGAAPTEGLAARARHPSNGPWRTDVARLAARVAHALEAEGTPWPGVASAARAARGVTGLDLGSFAARLGVPPDAIAAAEAGRTAPDALPAPLHEALEASAWFGLPPPPEPAGDAVRSTDDRAALSPDGGPARPVGDATGE